MNLLSSCFWTETPKRKSKKMYRKFSFCQNYQFQDQRFVTFHVITWLNFDLERNFFHQNIPQLRIPLWVSRSHTHTNCSRLGDFGEDIKGVKITPLGVNVDQKTLVFSGLNVSSIFQVIRGCKFTGTLRIWILTGSSFSRPVFLPTSDLYTNSLNHFRHMRQNN